MRKVISVSFTAAAVLALGGCKIDTSNHQSGDIKPDQAAAAISAVIASNNTAALRQIECPKANGSDTTNYGPSDLIAGLAANLPKINGAPPYDAVADKQLVDKKTADATSCVRSNKAFYTDINSTRQTAAFTYN